MATPHTAAARTPAPRSAVGSAPEEPRTEEPAAEEPPASLPPYDPTQREVALLRWQCAALTPDAVWRAVRSTVAAQRADRTGGQVAWTVIGGTPSTDEADMPRTDDSGEDFRAWYDRVRATRAPGGEPVLFYARDLAAHDRALFEVLLSALGSHADSFGLPRRGLDAEVFCGHYRATPGGVHRESSLNRHFVLAGRKSMHFWTGEDWIPAGTPRRPSPGMVPGSCEEHLPEVDGSAERRTRTTLTGEPGQVFAWVNGVWHIGEASDPAEPALTLNLAAYFPSYEVAPPFLLERTPAGEVTSAWLAAFRAFLDEPPGVRGTGGAGGGAAGALAAASAFGLRGADPSPRVRAGAPPTRVARATRAPLLWSAVDDGVIVATHGRAGHFDGRVAPWLKHVVRSPLGQPVAVPADAEHACCAWWLTTHGALAAG